MAKWQVRLSKVLKIKEPKEKMVTARDVGW